MNINSLQITHLLSISAYIRPINTFPGNNPQNT
jgi:hypothetical protein